MLGVFMAIILLGASPPAATPTPISDAEIDRQCRQYFKTAICSESLGAWLPEFLESFAPSNRNEAKRGVPADVFVFNHDGTSSNGPDGGSFFV